MTGTQGRKHRNEQMCKFSMESNRSWLRKAAKASWRTSQTLAAMNWNLSLVLQYHSDALAEGVVELQCRPSNYLATPQGGPEPDGPSG